MGLTDLANVDLQHSIKSDIDPSNFPRKTRQDAMACRLWLCGLCGKVLVLFLGVRLTIFFSLSLDEMLFVVK